MKRWSLEDWIVRTIVLSIVLFAVLSIIGAALGQAGVNQAAVPILYASAVIPIATIFGWLAVLMTLSTIQINRNSQQG